jgi:RNA polymerase sigma-70 factor (ECF subfamily)
LEREARATLQRDLTRLADGDREAFGSVFVRLWPVVRDFAKRQLPPADAEDAAQRALLRLFERAPEFDPERDALAWALGIAAWEIRSLRKWRGRRREAPETMPDAGGAWDGPSPEALVLMDERERSLQTALGLLGRRDVETLLAFAQGDRPPGAAFRKRLQRAHARLRLAFTRNHG